MKGEKREKSEERKREGGREEVVEVDSSNLWVQCIFKSILLQVAWLTQSPFSLALLQHACSGVVIQTNKEKRKIFYAPLSQNFLLFFLKFLLKTESMDG